MDPKIFAVVAAAAAIPALAMQFTGMILYKKVLGGVFCSPPLMFYLMMFFFTVASVLHFAAGNWLLGIMWAGIGVFYLWQRMSWTERLKQQENHSII